VKKEKKNKDKDRGSSFILPVVGKVIPPPGIIKEKSEAQLYADGIQQDLK